MNGNSRGIILGVVVTILAFSAPTVISPAHSFQPFTVDRKFSLFQLRISKRTCKVGLMRLPSYPS